MKFQAETACFDVFLDFLWARTVAFSSETKVERKLIRCLHHGLDMMIAVRAGCCIRTRVGTGTTANQARQTARKSLDKTQHELAHTW